MVVMDIYSIPQLDEIKEEIMVELRLSHYWEVNLTQYLTLKIN